MHITVEDQENDDRAILCVERGASHARVIQASPNLLPTLERIAQALGVDYLRMTIAEGTEQPVGWETSNLVIIAKALNGK